MKINTSIVIIGIPRSGTTFLKDLISFHSRVWYLPSESHSILEGPLHPRNFNYFSNTPDDGFLLSEKKLEIIRDQFLHRAINTNVVPGGHVLSDKFRWNRFSRKMILKILGHLSKLYKPDCGFYFLEKTPKNIVRIPVVHQIFPEAKFIYLKRNAIDNIASIYNGWITKTGFFYKLIKGKPKFAVSGYQMDLLDKFDMLDNYWRFVLPPGWKEQEFRDILDIAIFQYCQSNKIAEKDFSEVVKPSNLFRVQYEDLSVNTEKVIRNLLTFIGLAEQTYNFDSLRNIQKKDPSSERNVSKELKTEISHRLQNIRTS